MTATRELVVPVEKSEQVPARRITAANRFLKAGSDQSPAPGSVTCEIRY